MPFRSWCPARVRGKGQEASIIDDEVQARTACQRWCFDYCFLGAEEEEETVAMQVANAYMVPKKGISHELGTGSQERHHSHCSGRACKLYAVNTKT